MAILFMNSARGKNKLGSTQKFTEIEDIDENAVFLRGKQAASVLEITSTNFALLSDEEKAAKISAYGSLLNSLSFPIQVLIRSRKINILSYMKLLDASIQNAGNEQFKEYRRQYKEFVSELIKTNTLLDKKFYIVITFSAYEAGLSTRAHDFPSQAKTALKTRADSLMTQLARLNLRALVLDKEGLIRLFYDIYNHELDESYKADEATSPPIVKGGYQTVPPKGGAQ